MAAPSEVEAAIREALTLLEPEARLSCHQTSERAEDGENAVIARWAVLLYAHWYTRSTRRRAAREDSRRPDLVATLRAAHADTGRWEEGWIAQRVSSAGRVIAGRNGRRRLLDPVDYLNPGRPGLTPRPGEPVTTCMRRDTLRFQPGFWVTHSVTWPQPDGPGELLRLYWNVDDEGAAGLVAELTRELNELREPYALKCPVARADYTRVDAAVAFMPRRSFQAIRPVLRRVHTRLADQLQADVPPLTRRLAAGLALAENPGGNESFGMKRCRLVAEGVWAAGTAARDDAVSTVVQSLEEHGIDPRRPHLEPGSEHDYSL